MVNECVEIIRRVDYRFERNNFKTKEIFNKITSILYKRFLLAPSFMSLRMDLENIINGNLESFSKEDVLTLNILFNKYKTNFGINEKGTIKYLSVFNGNKVYDYESNDVLYALKKVLMADDKTPYPEIIKYFMLYIYSKGMIKLDENYDIQSNFKNDFMEELKVIDLFNSVFYDRDSFDLFIKNNRYIINKIYDVAKFMKERNDNHCFYNQTFDNVVLNFFDKQKKVDFFNVNDYSLMLLLSKGDNITTKDTTAPNIVR